MVAQAFNPSTQEAKVGGSLNSRPVWSIEQVPGSQHYTERPYLKKPTKKTKQNKPRKAQIHSIILWSQNPTNNIIWGHRNSTKIKDKSLSPHGTYLEDHIIMKAHSMEVLRLKTQGSL